MQLCHQWCNYTVPWKPTMVVAIDGKVTINGKFYAMGAQEDHLT